MQLDPGTIYRNLGNAAGFKDVRYVWIPDYQFRRLSDHEVKKVSSLPHNRKVIGRLPPDQLDATEWKEEYRLPDSVTNGRWYEAVWLGDQWGGRHTFGKVYDFNAKPYQKRTPLTPGLVVGTRFRFRSWPERWGKFREKEQVWEIDKLGHAIKERPYVNGDPGSCSVLPADDIEILDERQEKYIEFINKIPAGPPPPWGEDVSKHNQEIADALNLAERRAEKILEYQDELAEAKKERDKTKEEWSKEVSSSNDLLWDFKQAVGMSHCDWKSSEPQPTYRELEKEKDKAIEKFRNEQALNGEVEWDFKQAVGTSHYNWKEHQNLLSNTTCGKAKPSRKKGSIMKKSLILIAAGALFSHLPINDMYVTSIEYFKGSREVVHGEYYKAKVCGECETTMENENAVICPKCGTEKIETRTAAPLYRDRGWPLSDIQVGTQFRNEDGSTRLVLEDK